MTYTKTLNSKLMSIINGLGVIRCEEKRVDWNGKTYGHAIVWYDVCEENGEGDTIESFKTLKSAEKFALEY